MQMGQGEQIHQYAHAIRVHHLLHVFLQSNKMNYYSRTRVEMWVK